MFTGNERRASSGNRSSKVAPGNRYIRETEPGQPDAAPSGEVARAAEQGQPSVAAAGTS